MRDAHMPFQNRFSKLHVFIMLNCSHRYEHSFLLVILSSLCGASSLSVNQGPVRARKLLQKAAGVAADGVIGPLTLAAVRKAPSPEILGDFMARRALHYAGLAQLLRFGRGWFRRLFDIHRRALALS